MGNAILSDDKLVAKQPSSKREVLPSSVTSRLSTVSFIGTLAVGLLITFLVYQTEVRRHYLEHVQIADVLVDKVVTRIGQHVVVLRGAAGLLIAMNGDISREALSTYLDQTGVETDIAGIQGVGIAQMVKTADAEQLRDAIADQYQVDVAIRPDTDQEWRTPIVILEPMNERNLAALGYDMYANPERRSAMNRAIETGEAQMSAPVELVQEITEVKQAGFLIYLPFRAKADNALGQFPDGFVYAPFRTGDLIAAALGNATVDNFQMRIADTELPGQPLYDTQTSPKLTGPEVRSRVEVFGRRWDFTITFASTGAQLGRFNSTLFTGLASLILAFATRQTIQKRQSEAQAALDAAELAQRDSEHRQLLLQEMNHRIKNHITRIQSIARQSARSATSVKEFTEAFDARLRSMAQAQDLLAGNAVQQTDVVSILKKELSQAEGNDDARIHYSGPRVNLGEAKAHSFALVVHELVTNALKYGGLSIGGGGISVEWSMSEDQKVSMTWIENLPETATVPPSGPVLGQGGGFGLRLIEACLRGELDGEITRSAQDGKLVLQLTFRA